MIQMKIARTISYLIPTHMTNHNYMKSFSKINNKQIYELIDKYHLPRLEYLFDQYAKCTPQIHNPRLLPLTL